MHPIVSVIIPNYNHAEFLQQRIDSVLNQTFHDFEVIILDDNSTDNSKEVIEANRSHPKVKQVVYNQTNSGSTFKQWRKGLELAKGKYIWIAESDDFADKTFLQTLIQPFLRQPDLILAYCQSMMVDEKSSPLGVSEWADELDNFKWKQDYVEQASVELNNFLSFRNTIVNASAVVFRKPSNTEILEESSTMKILGDWLFWRKLLSQEGKIAFFSAPLNFFRVHPNTTRAVTTKEKEVVRMKEYHRLIIPEYLSITDSRYDWMLQEWYRNRNALKNSVNYYIPDVPTILLMRFFLKVASKAPRKCFHFIKRHAVLKIF